MEQSKNPKHIAIILDGNRRYAKKIKLNPWEGHKFGAEKIKELLKWSQELGVKELTLYSFSIDNFNRTDKEKHVLFELFKKYISELKNDKRIMDNGIKVTFIGRLGMFPKELQKEMHDVMEKTGRNDKFKINFAMAYSGKAEIVDAAKKIIERIKKNDVKAEEVDEKLFNENLYLKGSPDMLIRPGGEKRISDFLLWQSSYTELFFVDKLWPEFTKQDLVECIEEFKRRERRFGK